MLYFEPLSSFTSMTNQGRHEKMNSQKIPKNYLLHTQIKCTSYCQYQMQQLLFFILLFSPPLCVPCESDFLDFLFPIKLLLFSNIFLSKPLFTEWFEFSINICFLSSWFLFKVSLFIEYFYSLLSLIEVASDSTTSEWKICFSKVYPDSLYGKNLTC